MEDSGLQCFRKESLKNLKDRFLINKTEFEAALAIQSILDDAYDKYTTNLYDAIQKFQNKIDS